MKVKIEDVKMYKGKEIPTPIIVGSIHGQNLHANADHVNIKVDNLESRECKVAFELNNMLYGGKYDDGKQSSTVMLALRNRKTNKVKLVEVSAVHFAPMVVPPSSQNTVLMEKRDEKNKTSMAMSKEFVHKFGMLKGQRLYDQAERMMVKSDHVRGAIENSALKAAVNHEALTPIKSNPYEELLPPRNPNPTKGMDVYSMDDIIGQEDMMALEQLAQKLVETKYSNVPHEQCSPYFLSVLKHLVDNCSEHHNQIRLVSALLFLEFIMAIAIGKQPSDNELLKSFPSSVKVKILKEFFNGSFAKRRLSRIEKDKATCYVLVLALLIQNCSVDADLIGASLKIGAEQLESLVRVVGAKIVRTLDKRSIALTIPLSQPMERGKGKGKGKRK